MALTYAGGPLKIKNSRPKSAFSRGDVIMFDSASSLSFANPLGTAASEYAGVAISSSTESYRSKVPYIVAQPMTEFWVTIAAGSAVSEGFNYDLVPSFSLNYGLSHSQGIDPVADDCHRSCHGIIA